MHELCSCSSIRALARNHGVGRKTVENRIMRLARQGLALQLRALERVDLQENLVADGLEGFWVSHYFPNNLHVVVGAESQFVYGWNGVTIRRSGRMNASQLCRREELERRYRADPQGVKRSFRSIAELSARLFARSGKQGLCLITDQHQAYPRALKSLAEWEGLTARRGVTHRRYSSRLPRTLRNPLFPVNYIDRECRKDLAEHVRETTRFARSAHTSMERFSVYLVAHNFFKQRRINVAVGEGETHAQAAGIGANFTSELRRWFFSSRVMMSHLVITAPFLRIWLRMYETPLARHGPYLPRYLLA